MLKYNLYYKCKAGRYISRLEDMHFGLSTLNTFTGQCAHFFFFFSNSHSLAFSTSIKVISFPFPSDRFFQSHAELRSGY